MKYDKEEWENDGLSGGLSCGEAMICYALIIVLVPLAIIIADYLTSN
jgi:hypothetical protein